MTINHSSLSYPSGIHSIEFFPCRKQACLDLFEPFSVLINRANRWLLANPATSVKTCETFVISYRTVQSKTLHAPHILSSRTKAKRAQVHIRCLRLWVQTKHRNGYDVLPDRLGYVNVLWRKHGLLGEKSGKIEELEKMVNRAVSRIEGPKKLISVESFAVKYEGKFTKPDKSGWRDRQSEGESSTTCFRVHYVEAVSQAQMVALEEFWPLLIRKGSKNKPALYENFPELLSRVQVSNCELPTVNLCPLDIYRCQFGNGKSRAKRPPNLEPVTS